MKRKTIRQWLWGIKDETIREIALEYYANDLQRLSIERRLEKQKRKIRNFEGAISSAFIWSSTPQQHDYWSNFSRQQEVYEDKQ